MHGPPTAHSRGDDHRLLSTVIRVNSVHRCTHGPGTGGTRELQSIQSLLSRLKIPKDFNKETNLESIKRQRGYGRHRGLQATYFSLVNPLEKNITRQIQETVHQKHASSLLDAGSRRSLRVRSDVRTGSGVCTLSNSEVVRRMP